MQQPSLFPEISDSDKSRHLSRRERLEDYDSFVDKFKPKLTTDDCYTPPYIYDIIRQWVNDNICPLDGVPVVRPFYPGGDYRRADYPDGCIVLDNPPFSILAAIRRFYYDRAIRYVLFAPALTTFAAPLDGETYICPHGEITYENGAIVRTNLITNLTPQTRIWVAGDLYKAIRQATEQHRHAIARSLTKHIYPDNVVSSAILGRLSVRGITLKIPAADCQFIRALDEQRAAKKAIFGGGFLLSERVAAERVAAERAAAERVAAERAAASTWELSDRERAIIANLG